MNILLLGATGYLGGNIVYKLVEEGHSLTCVVRKTSITKRIEDLHVTFISNDLDEIDGFLRHNKIDWVINSVCTYTANNTLYGDMFSSNIIFPLGILNLALKHGVKNYITIGTSLPEETNLYSFTKNKFGEFGKYLCKNDGINFADLKLEMFYGGLFEPDNRFLPSCKIKLKKNENIKLTAGTQKRDIIRVEDVVGIIACLIKSGYLHGYMSLPVGTGEHHSIREILEYMRSATRSKSELLFGAIPTRACEPDTIADVSWYADIGYKLQFDFFYGLIRECMRAEMFNSAVISGGV